MSAIVSDEEANAIFELISDLVKDTNGFCPSRAYIDTFMTKTPEDKQSTWNSLCDELSYREAETARQELASQRNYETRITGMVNDYSIDRATAIRWDLDAFDIGIDDALRYHGSAIQEIEHFLYNQGMSFQVFPMYVTEITAAIGLNDAINK